MWRVVLYELYSAEKGKVGYFIDKKDSSLPSQMSESN